MRKLSTECEQFTLIFILNHPSIAGIRLLVKNNDF